jgi:2-haloalkanoic acid dehalogenase type II
MPPARPLLAIALDLDDTLWPARPTLVAAEEALLTWLAEHAPRTAAASTPEQRKVLRAQVLAEHPARAHDVSFVRLETLRRAFRAAGDAPVLAETAFEVFLEARQQVQCYDDVVPVLARWAERYRLVAVSNGNADVERVGLGRFFSARVSAHELDFGKPDPRIFLEACRRLDVAPSAVLHVGDDPDLDVLAARRAGLNAAWIRRPDLAAPGGKSPDLSPGEGGKTLQSFDSLAAIDEFLHGAPPAERDEDVEH